MEDREIGVEQARPKLGELVDDAAVDGEVTYLTRRGRRHAAIVPQALAKELELRRRVTAALLDSGLTVRDVRVFTGFGERGPVIQLDFAGPTDHRREVAGRAFDALTSAGLDMCEEGSYATDNMIEYLAAGGTALVGDRG